LRAFSSAALRAALEKAHYCVRVAHAIMGGSAYPELTLNSNVISFCVRLDSLTQSIRTGF
ncbi:hypothetical protein, partial [Leptolyngbya sp. FACHB-16]|uniref:hypothetical protein n=1 Tax=unclassified Leptolyngbya TaxID=2650499 RepID=UPI001A7E6417